MHRPTCPFAAALFGSISGSAAGAAVGAMTGWLLHAAYAGGGGADAGGVAVLVFGTLGMGIGGSGGAVGGMIEGWGLAGGRGAAEGPASGARWGAGLGALWGLQPILWLTFRVHPGLALRSSLGITLAVVALGAVAALLGSLTARQVVRSSGMIPPSSIPVGRRH